MRLLLAGASGFIGRHLVKRLRNDHEVYAMSRTSLGESSHGEVCRWEAAEPLDVASLPGSVDVVCYAATSRHHRDERDGADDLFTVNVAGVVPLLKWAREVGVGQFVYLSTGSVYGTGCADERERAIPSNFYGASKLAGETLVAGYDRFFDVFIPRLYTPFGPGQDDRLVPGLIDRVVSGRPVELHGSDGFVVSPTFIEDVVDVLARSIDQRWRGVINLAGPHPLPLREIAVAIGDVVGREPRFAPASPGQDRPPDQHPTRQRLDARLGPEFAWTDLADGLAATWRSRPAL